MPRKPKKYKYLNCKLDKTVSEKLEKFAEETGLSKTATIEKALRMYLENYYKTGKI